MSFVDLTFNFVILGLRPAFYSFWFRLSSFLAHRTLVNRHGVLFQSEVNHGFATVCLDTSAYSVATVSRALAMR
jgi:hypothetical protein